MSSSSKIRNGDFKTYFKIVFLLRNWTMAFTWNRPDRACLVIKKNFNCYLVLYKHFDYYMDTILFLKSSNVSSPKNEFYLYTPIKYAYLSPQSSKALYWAISINLNSPYQFRFKKCKKCSCELFLDDKLNPKKLKMLR